MKPDLYHWRKPAELMSEVRTWGDQLGNAAMSGGGQDFRDAFVAASFGLERAELVRMLPTREIPTPDFAIYRDGLERWYEITEADHPARRRTAEYASQTAPVDQIVQVTDDEWASPEAYFAVVSARVEKKSSKVYDRCDGLILFSNLAWIERSHELTADWWRRATLVGKNQFPSIFVCVQGLFYPIWINGVGCEVRMTDPPSIDGLAGLFD